MSTPEIHSSTSNTQLDKTLTHSVSITNVADFDSEKKDECKNIITPEGSPFSSQVNICSAPQGAKVLFATDEWFATADNLLKEGPPKFDLEAYCEQVSSFLIRFDVSFHRLITH